MVFACHFPFVNVPGYYFMRMHQERSYVAALTGAGKLPGMYYSVDAGGLSLRSAGDLLLVGGGGHRDLAFQHTADEAFYPVFLCHLTDFQCVMDAPGLHQFDVEIVSGVGLYDM